MLNVKCEEQLEKARKFADSWGAEWRAQLEDRLEYLDTYAEHGNRGRSRCDLYSDFAPHSFYFCLHVRDDKSGEYKMWFNGGLILHADHDRGGDGGLPTFSVNIGGRYGWAIHT